MSDLTRRIFIDSRHRLPTSEGHGNFECELPWPVHAPAGSLLNVDNVVLSHVWPTVSTTNCNLYLEETSGGTKTHRMITLAQDQYTLGTMAAELQAKLRAGSSITNGLYSVTHSSNRLEISNSSATDQAYLFSRKDMTGGTVFAINWVMNGQNVATSSKFSEVWAAATVVTPAPAPSPLADACELIGLMSTGATIQPNVPFKLQHADLARHKSLYLCCSNLGESTTLDLTGRTDIIRKLDVGASRQGEVIVSALQSDAAFSVIQSDTTLHHMSFQIRDCDGDIVPFYDHQVTFQLILTRPADR